MQRISRFAVSLARGRPCSCLGLSSWPWFQASRPCTSRCMFDPGSFLRDLQNTFLPLMTPGSPPLVLCSAPGKLLTRPDRFSGLVPCPAVACRACPTVQVFSSRGSAGLDLRPLRVRFAATPCSFGSRRTAFRCLSKGGLGCAEVASQLAPPGPVLLPAQVFHPACGPDQPSSGTDGILRPLVLALPLRKVREGVSKLSLRSRPCLVSLSRFVVSVFRCGLPVR